MQQEKLPNYVGGQWLIPKSAEFLDIHNPATAETLSQVPLSGGAEVDAAAQAAKSAFQDWRRTPPTERIQYLFKLKVLLEDSFEEIAHAITRECGKTLNESKGELRRGIENVEVATGIPSLIMGNIVEDIAPGIDELMIRQPVGVVAAITPFNFPAMIPFWFLPYAIACGNTFICKPSEKVPISMKIVFDLIDQLDLPSGVVNLVQGSRDAVEAILSHPDISAISFVGSSAVAKQIYAKAAAHGKRVQCGGGAKNPIVVLPDADMGMATQSVAESAFGCAGQRCLATSIVMTVGEENSFQEHIVEAALSRKIGYGLDPEVEMGPVITTEAKERIQNMVARGIEDGAELLVDGRNPSVTGYEKGYFVRPTVLGGVDSNSTLAHTEVFGPVLGLLRTATLEEAIRQANSASYGNMACLFTNSGSAARRFRYQTVAGNVGINIGVAAPMAFFPFSGFKDSFFGDLHPQGRDAIDFYTEKKIVVERWP